jgi:hypothetical protein
MYAVGRGTRSVADSGGAASLIDPNFELRVSRDADLDPGLEREAALHMVGLRHHDLNCSLSLAVFKEPVMTIDGSIYEKSLIMRFWKEKGEARSPLTNLQLSNTSLRRATIVQNFIESFVQNEIESGKAAALAGSNLEKTGPRALEIERVLQQILTHAVSPSEHVLHGLLQLLDNEHLRDFAARCGALQVAATCFASSCSAAATALLLRMLAFSLVNQQQVQFTAREAEAALLLPDPEMQTRGLQVLAALVADGGTLQLQLEAHLHELLAPLVASGGSAPLNLCAAVLLFAVHLVQHRSAETSRRLCNAGLVEFSVHVLERTPADSAPTAAPAALACWFLSLLWDLHDSRKQRLLDTPRLVAALVRAISINVKFSLQALAVVVGPRRAAMDAVAVLSAPSSSGPARASALVVLAAATRSPTPDSVAYGDRPATLDVVNYVCRNIGGVLEAIECTEDADSLEHGLRLLTNLVAAMGQAPALRRDAPAESPPALMSQRLLGAQGDRITAVVESTTRRIFGELDVDGAAQPWYPQQERWHAACLQAFAFFRHYTRMIAPGEFAQISAVAKTEVVGACLDVLHFAKNTLQQHTAGTANATDAAADADADGDAALGGLVTDALAILETFCSRLDYRDIGCTSLCRTLLALVEPRADEFARRFCLPVLELVHALVCSSEEPVRFCMLRGAAAANDAFRAEMLRRGDHARLWRMLEARSGTPQEDLAVLAVLRDSVAVLPTHRASPRLARFYKKLVEGLLAEIERHVRGVLCCPLTVMACCETLANLLIANVLPRSLLRDSAAASQTTLAAVRVLAAQSPCPFFALEQALRVTVLLASRPCGCGARGGGSCPIVAVSNPLATHAKTDHLRDARALEKLVAADALGTMAATLALLRSPAPELACASGFCAFRHQALPSAARCAELVVVFAVLALGQCPDQPTVEAFIASALAKNLSTTFEQEDALTPAVRNLAWHALARLTLSVAAARTADDLAFSGSAASASAASASAASASAASASAASASAKRKRV